MDVHAASSVWRMKSAHLSDAVRPAALFARGFSDWIVRALCVVYGAVAYTVFLGTFVYAVGFTSRFIAPKTINSGGTLPPLYAVAVNLALLGLVALQHSGMVRSCFKRLLTCYVSPVIERTTYVLCTSLVLIVLFAFWQPIRAVVWHVDNLSSAFLVLLLSMAGWSMVLYSTFLAGHFELFGLKIRHPIHLGFIIAFWATPTMTVGNLLFAAVTTAYIFIDIALEERN
jgi:methanethiol S-methyltransferase